MQSIAKGSTMTSNPMSHVIASALYACCAWAVFFRWLRDE
jgi:hypothetical protein